MTEFRAMEARMSNSKTLGVVLFDKFELLDVFGPCEAYGLRDLGGAFQIVTVAAQAGPITSAQGPRAQADYALKDCPPLDLMLAPGGVGTRREVENSDLLDWLRDRAARAEIVSSVCTGAALLARAGLLDGRRATTNKRAFEWVESQGPNVNWIKSARWVEDGRFWTSSGVSAGIDMALAIIARLLGSDAAEQAARVMEYEWRRDAARDPFARLYGLA
jgi:transcriptional regulator GlxA family with amidase domain